MAVPVQQSAYWLDYGRCYTLLKVFTLDNHTNDRHVPQLTRSTLGKICNTRTGVWYVCARERERGRDTDPDIELAGPNPFWNAHSVNNSTGDVKHSHQDEPAESREVHWVVDPVCDSVVHGRDHPAQAQRDKCAWKFNVHGVKSLDTISQICTDSWWTGQSCRIRLSLKKIEAVKSRTREHLNVCPKWNPGLTEQPPTK